MNNFFSYFKEKSDHRWLAILLFTVLIGVGMLVGSGEVYAGGSFDVPKVNDGFNKFEQDSPPQQEQTGSAPSVKEKKDSGTQSPSRLPIFGIGRRTSFPGHGNGRQRKCPPFGIG